MTAPRLLLIDNYDSFTWNLADYVAQTFGVEPLIVRNDEGTWAQVRARGPFDAIVVSPGPGSVTNAADFNMSRDALEQDVHLEEHHVHVEGGGPGRLAAAEDEEALRELRGALGRPPDLEERLRARVAGLDQLRREFRVAQDDRQQVVEIVGDASSKYAQAFNLL